MTSLLLLSHPVLFAQHKSLQVGLKGGLNLSSLQLADPAIPAGRTKLGLNLGATVSYYLKANLFLQSGLSLTSKGMKLRGTSSLGFGDNSVLPGREASLISQQWYGQIPLYLGYALPLGGAIKLVFNAGPYVAYGLGGKTRLTGDIVYDDVIDYGTWEEPTFGKRGLQRLDVGIGAEVGIELGRATIGLAYEVGLRDISPTQWVYIPFYPTSYKNRLLSLSIQHRL
ncbi:MAG: PorT family protein [Spirosoma sp.]|uniref:porin family protein n=1 Tax=Spirosoma sp. TaxID=1899569 RepID=UPI001AC474F0|nr:porin family protein [Spirosoma sp.]MBN8821244.1 PorT family protein [Spirosoma sp.]